jgi:hypothetical protein
MQKSKLMNCLLVDRTDHYRFRVCFMIPNDNLIVRWEFKPPQNLMCYYELQ